MSIGKLGWSLGAIPELVHTPRFLGDSSQLTLCSMGVGWGKVWGVVRDWQDEVPGSGIWEPLMLNELKNMQKFEASNKIL